MEQCSEPEFSAEVAAEGGEDGAESLKVCLAVGRALNERLLASLQETAAPARAATDPSDLVALPMPGEGLSPLPAEAEGEAVVESSDEVSNPHLILTSSSPRHHLTLTPSSPNPHLIRIILTTIISPSPHRCAQELPVGEVDGAMAAVLAARAERGRFSPSFFCDFQWQNAEIAPFSCVF